jgi:hypothetical protein
MQKQEDLIDKEKDKADVIEMTDDRPKEVDSWVDLLEKKGIDKNYSPLPQKGQDIAKFEKEELQPNGITFKELVKTDYYYDVLKKNSVSSDIVKEAHELGLNPGNEMIQPKDNQDNVEHVDLEVNDSEIEKDDMDIIESPFVAASFPLKTPLGYDIKERSTFDSAVKVVKSPINEDYILMYDGPSVQFSNLQQFREAFPKLIMDVLNYYDGIVSGVERVLEPLKQLKKIAKPGALGFDVMKKPIAIRDQTFIQILSMLRLEN